MLFSEIEHKIWLINLASGSRVAVTVNDEGTATAQVSSGVTYKIEVKAFVDGWDFAEGESEDFSVAAGETKNVPIDMQRMDSAVVLSIPKSTTSHAFPPAAVNGSLSPWNITIFNYTNGTASITATISPEIHFEPPESILSIEKDGSQVLSIAPNLQESGSHNATLTISANGSEIAIATINLSAIVTHDHVWEWKITTEFDQVTGIGEATETCSVCGEARGTPPRTVTAFDYTPGLSLTPIADSKYSVSNNSASGHVEIPGWVYYATNPPGNQFFQITTIAQLTFANNAGITSVTIHEGVTTIADGAFNNSGLIDIVIPSSVTSIGAAFSNCANLESIKIPVGVDIDTIRTNTFLNCKSLKSIEIPASVETIEGSAFSGCDNLVSVTFMGNGPIDIGFNAFPPIGGDLGTAYAAGGAGTYTREPGDTAWTMK